MKKLGIERHGTSTYLVYELGPEDTVDNMSLGMLVNNRIPLRQFLHRPTISSRLSVM